MLTQDNQSKDRSQSEKDNEASINGAFSSDDRVEPVSLENLLDDVQQNSQVTKAKKWNWRSLNLRTKATALAIAIGTLPVIAIGTAAYFAASAPLREEVFRTQTEQANQINDKLNRFMFERFGDIQAIANLPTLRDPKVQAVTTPKSRQELLESYIKFYRVYDSIALYDLDGNL